MAYKTKVGVIIFMWLTALFVFNEFFIYYLAIWTCSFPKVVDSSENEIVRAMILADPHLLGEKNGALIDRLRREWQMERSFQTGVSLLNPDVVFILGDIMDEGQDASQEDFDFALHRYNNIFRSPGSPPVFVVAGNHDIGFHYVMTEAKVERFEKAFSTPSVQVFSLKDIPFVLLNSVGLEKDGCWLCSGMEKKIREAGVKLRQCSPELTEENCLQQPLADTNPVLLQHYPLYRSSDMLCHGDDLAPDIANQREYRESWEVLSKEATETVLSHFRPRVAFSGHTHHGCNIMHHLGTPYPTEEQTIASFSWRNKNNPNFILLTVSNKDYSFDKCYLPQETTVLACYVLGLLVPMLFLLWPCLKRRWRPQAKAFNLKDQTFWSQYDRSAWKSRKGT